MSTPFVQLATKPGRPLLRYHGGKFRLRDWVLAHFPPHDIYTEPFGGAGSVLLAKPRSKAEVYNDLDGEIVNVFRCMQNARQSRRLRQMLRYTPFARDEFDLSYEPDPDGDPVENARRTIVKGFFGFGSESIHRPAGFRSRVGTRAPNGFRRSVQNTTTPATEWANYHESIRQFCERLSGVVIENRPAAEVIETFDRLETLHYLDPPYVLETRTGAKLRYGFEMSNWDHELLLAQINSVDGMVILSGYDSDIYTTALAGWTRYEKDARAAQGAARTEVLWLNPRAQSELDRHGITPTAPGTTVEPTTRDQADLFSGIGPLRPSSPISSEVPK